jgi:hypothetical protein
METSTALIVTSQENGSEIQVFKDNPDLYEF